MDPERPASAEELEVAERLTAKRVSVASKGTGVLIVSALLVALRFVREIQRKPLVGWSIVFGFFALFSAIGWFLLWQLAVQMRRDLALRMVRERTGVVDHVTAVKNNYGETIVTFDLGRDRFISRNAADSVFMKGQTVRIVYLPTSKATLRVVAA